MLDKKKMKYIRLFEQFGKKNEIMIVGVPSGEVFFVDGDLFDDIYNDGMLKYNIEFDESFYCFDDNQKYKIQRMMVFKYGDKEKQVVDTDTGGKTYMIFRNEFGDNFTKELKTVLSKFKSNIKIIIDGRNLKLLYNNKSANNVSDSEIDIVKDQTFLIKIYRKGVKVEFYSVPNEEMLLQRIESEARFYFK